MNLLFYMASEGLEKGGGDLNREVSHTKCQCYKSVRTEAAKSF